MDSRGKDTTLSEDAKLVITCTCGQKMKVPAAAQGKKYKCVRCGNALLVGEEPIQAPAQSSGDQPGMKSPAPAPAIQAAPPNPPRPAGKERIGELLIKAGIVTGAQVAEALELQSREGGKTFENLIKLGHLDKTALHEFLSRQPGIAAINLANYTIEQELVQLVPKEMALRELVLPIDRLGKLLTVAMACPLDGNTVEEIEALTGLRVKAMLCKLDDIHKAVEALYRHSAGTMQRTISLADLPGLSQAAAPEAKSPSTCLTEELVNRFQAIVETGSARDVVEAAQKEPAVTEALLAAVNQGGFGEVDVESVGMAIALLGVGEVPQVLSRSLAQQ
jgi:hypothetical protein